jgi:hypothetical protein
VFVFYEFKRVFPSCLRDPYGCPRQYASTLLESHFTTQQATMSSRTGDDDDDSLSPALWSQQDPEFNNNFPVLDKRDFKFMRGVRKYAPNQMVNWPRVCTL